MKIISSSPYAAFNPKEWNAFSSTNHGFSSTPIKIKKKYFNTFNKTKANKNLPDKIASLKQMQLTFV